jgi:hypothetical protein
MLSFDHGRPPQLVAGNGGTELARSIQTSVNGSLVHGASVVMSGSQHEFGYTQLSKVHGSWNLSLKSRAGGSLFEGALPK